MRRHIRYHPDFDLDVIETAEWYAKGSRNLAFDFTIKVERAVASLLDGPERRSDAEFGLRYWPLERFPHVIFFDYNDTEIFLIGVMHPSQRPEKWIARNE